jgi:hypothetical protein
MGLFDKPSKAEQKKLDESIATFKSQVVSNFSSVEASGKKYSSSDIAEIGAQLLLTSLKEDDDDLRTFAIHVTLAIKKSTNTDLSVKDRGQLCFTITSNSMTLRQRYERNKDKSINKNITIIGLALMSILESSKDWEQVLDATLEYSKKFAK